MDSKPYLRLLTTISCVAFVLILLTNARPTFAQCDKTSDAQIVADIYGRISGDKGLATQISHINVVSINAAVKFQGWANSKSDYDKVVGFALNGSCAKLVNVNLFLDAPPAEGNSLRSSGGCTSGTKACGDICIPEGDACNITGLKAFERTIFRFDPNETLALFGRVAACVP
jgi:hypothetical protein